MLKRLPSYSTSLYGLALCFESFEATRTNLAFQRGSSLGGKCCTFPGNSDHCPSFTSTAIPFSLVPFSLVEFYLAALLGLYPDLPSLPPVTFPPMSFGPKKPLRASSQPQLGFF